MSVAQPGISACQSQVSALQPVERQNGRGVYMDVDIERKHNAILAILAKSNEPLGARVISRMLEEDGIHLTERAVRFHMQLMDERGLTHTIFLRIIWNRFLQPICQA